jgi:hypothetical protein
MSEFKSAWDEIKAGMGLFFKILMYSAVSIAVFGGLSYVIYLSRF